MSDDRSVVSQTLDDLRRRMGWQEEFAKDVLLGGSVEEVREKLGRLRETGVDTLFVPTFVPTDVERHLDAFMAEVVPAFR
jgi:alkanesulfonate monooxygenase SsuD/methylene tetrahydromethanopterin reductase-like flavin-dependent oxidoreductase (luciferase family)